MKHPDLDISFGACFLTAAGLLLLPLDWLVSAMAAAAIHEMGHLAVLRGFGIPIHDIRIGFTGARIGTGPMPAFTELLCAAAGPLFSFGAALLSRWFPVLGLIALAQGVFNLVPVYPMDGGRICRAMGELLRERGSERKISCKRQR